MLDDFYANRLARSLERRYQIARADLVIGLDQQPADCSRRHIRFNLANLAPGQAPGGQTAGFLDAADVIELQLVVAMPRHPERALLSIATRQPAGRLDLGNERGIATKAVELQINQGRGRQFDLEGRRQHPSGHSRCSKADGLPLDDNDGFASTGQLERA